VPILLVERSIQLVDVLEFSITLASSGRSRSNGPPGAILMRKKLIVMTAKSVGTAVARRRSTNTNIDIVCTPICDDHNVSSSSTSRPGCHPTVVAGRMMFNYV
jgi:hypothetical protein